MCHLWLLSLDLYLLSYCSINYNCPALKDIALGLSGGVALRGLHFQPQFIDAKSIKSFSSSIFNYGSAPLRKRRGIIIAKHVGVFIVFLVLLWHKTMNISLLPRHLQGLLRKWEELDNGHRDDIYAPSKKRIKEDRFVAILHMLADVFEFRFILFFHKE